MATEEPSHKQSQGLQAPKHQPLKAHLVPCLPACQPKSYCVQRSLLLLVWWGNTWSVCGHTKLLAGFVGPEAEVQAMSAGVVHHTLAATDHKTT